MSDRHPRVRRGLLVVFAGQWLAVAPAADRIEDPTRPPDALLKTEQTARPMDVDPEGSGVGGWRLTSVLLASERRVAVLNGKFVREGDMIGGARVERIEQDRIHIREGVESVEIGLFTTHVLNRMVLDDE